MSAQTVVVATTLPKAKRVCRVGLSLANIKRLKEELRKKTPSEPWVEEQIKSVERIDEHGRQIVHRFHDKNAFPPGGSKTLMLRCPLCDIFNPPHALEAGQCLDHSEHVGWGQSPSARAIERAQYFHSKVLECELVPESDEAIAEEIRQPICTKMPDRSKKVEM
ncbi:MAG TPA: hypothetical protein VH370_20670 [Humisphaera sp.]|jgi:hypothetical protein|nr:hypothetical protein [Humisphaera sp.]